MSLKKYTEGKTQFTVDNIMFDIFVNLKNKKTKQHIVYHLNM